MSSCSGSKRIEWRNGQCETLFKSFRNQSGSDGFEQLISKVRVMYSKPVETFALLSLSRFDFLAGSRWQRNSLMSRLWKFVSV